MLFVSYYTFNIWHCRLANIETLAALVAYNVSKDWTLGRLRDYTKDNSVTASGGHEVQEPVKEGEPLRRSVNRRL